MSTPRLILPQPLAAAIIAHARAGKPEEVCGLVRGRDGRATAIHPARNIAPNPITDYEVEAKSLLAQVEWEDAGDELIALYHSHPQDPAYPSASDAIQAHYPDSVYLICSLLDDARPDLQGFFLREIDGDLDPTACRRALPFYRTRPGRWGYYLPAGAALPSALAGLRPPPGLALYIVIQEDAAEPAQARAVAVAPVELLID
jgi:proteasome lid subunit RPN8/RPN11